MDVPQLLVASPLRIFEWATGKSDAEVAHIILNASLFIHPNAVREKPVQFPDCVRESNEYHPLKAKGAESVWLAQPVKVWDNTKARIAFGRYIGRAMNAANREVSVGWEVAHIWGRVFDPEYFTAGWNMVLIPGFLRVLTEEQAGLPLFNQCLQNLAWRIFFEEGPVAAPKAMPHINPIGVPDWLSTFEPRYAGGEG